MAQTGKAQAWKACVRKDSGVQISPSALWLLQESSILLTWANNAIAMFMDGKLMTEHWQIVNKRYQFYEKTMWLGQ